MSTITGWAVLAVWAAGWVITARKVSLALIAGEEASSREALDTENRIANRVMGCLVGLVWPLALLGAVMTGKLPKTDMQLRAEREKLAREIADLEAENERLKREQESLR